MEFDAGTYDHAVETSPLIFSHADWMDLRHVAHEYVRLAHNSADWGNVQRRTALCVRILAADYAGSPDSIERFSR